jgi:hypothetical protein
MGDGEKMWDTFGAKIISIKRKTAAKASQYRLRFEGLPSSESWDYEADRLFRTEDQAEKDLEQQDFD